MRNLTFVGLLLASTAASAADLPRKYDPPMLPAAAFNWTGFGLELYGLYGVNFGTANVHDDVGAGITSNLTGLAHGPGIGGGFWYFYQPAQTSAVFGLRAEISYANLSGGANTNLGLPLSVNNATNFLGDVDACLGFTLSGDGRLLGYGCGGFAFGGAKPNLQVASVQAAASDTSTGYNFALGLKYAITQNWVLGIEGDYYKLSDKSASITLGGVPIVTSNVPYDIFVQKLTIGYRF